MSQTKKKRVDTLEQLLSHGTGDLVTEADRQALDELAGDLNPPALEEYILSCREREQKQQRQKEENIRPAHPFAHLITPRLHELAEYWHPAIVRGTKEELARRELIVFTQQTYPGYIANWHHVEYAKKLDAFIRGEIKNLMVFMPPQHGKSELCSRRMPAKLLGDNPNLRIAVISYNHIFASKFNRDVQRIIDSDDYRALYPETFLNAQNIRTVVGSYLRNADEFEIVGKRGGLVSVGVGGGLTGRPVDILIIDDPYKSQKEAWSPTVRRSIQDWYDTVALTRLHNNSQQLITLTRWHEDDLAGRILKSEPEKWEVVKFPAIKEGGILPYDPRQPGEALWPEVHSLERMEAVKKRNVFVFQAMYQQDPKPAEGLLFPADTLNYFNHEDIKDVKFDSIVAVSDVADRGKDYYCMLLGGLLGNLIYILDVIYTQEPVKVTIPLTLGMLRDWRPVKHRIESNGGGSIFAYSIREQKTTPTIIEEKVTSSNKETRILMASGLILEYCYFWEDYAPDSQYAEYMGALTSYLLAGGNEHDDAPDATTMMVELVHPTAPEFIFRVMGEADNEPEQNQNPQEEVPAPRRSFLSKVLGRLSDRHPDNWR